MVNGVQQNVQHKQVILCQVAKIGKTAKVVEDSKRETKPK